MRQARPQETFTRPLALLRQQHGGRCYLVGRALSILPGLTLDHLILEVLPAPEAHEPVDMRRHRTVLHALRWCGEQAEIEAALQHACSPDGPLQHASLQLGESRILLGAQVRVDDTQVLLSWRLGTLSEPANGDARPGEVALVPLGIRAYGVAHAPPEQLVERATRQLIERLAPRSPEAQPRIEAPRYTPWLDGDVLRWRVVKWLMLQLCSPRGWRLPSVSSRAGLVLRSTTRALELVFSTEGVASAGLSREASAARAYELAELQARRRFVEADADLRAGDTEDALRKLERLQLQFGMQPALIERLAHAMLAKSEPSLRVIEHLVREVTRRAPDALQSRLIALQAAARLGKSQAAVETLRRLLAQLGGEGDRLDRVLALVALAWFEEPQSAPRAATALNEALRLRPDCRLVLAHLEAFYSRHQQPASRVEVLQRLRALATRPAQRRELDLDLAETLRDELRDPESALAIYQAHFEIDFDDLEVLEGLAKTLLVMSQLFDAVRALMHAASIAQQRDLPSSRITGLHHATARVWFRLEELEQAQVACQMALELDPGHMDARQLIIEILFDQQHFDACLKHLRVFERLLEARLARLPQRSSERAEVKSALVDALQMIAHLQQERGREEALVVTCRRLLLHAPDDDFALGYLEQHYQRTGRPGALIGLYEHHLERLEGPEQAVLCERLAELYDGTLQLPTQAVAYLDRAIEAAPEHHVRLQRKKIALLEQRELHFELRSLLERLVSQSVDAGLQTDAMITLSNLYVDVFSDREGACALLERAMRRRPDDAAILRTLLAYYERAGDHHLPARIEALERLAVLEPNAEARRDMLIAAGDLIHDVQGEPEKAYRFYQQAQQLRSDPVLTQRLAEIMRRPLATPRMQVPKGRAAMALAGGSRHEEGLERARSAPPEAPLPPDEDEELPIWAHAALLGRSDLEPAAGGWQDTARSWVARRTHGDDHALGEPGLTADPRVNPMPPPPTLQPKGPARGFEARRDELERARRANDPAALQALLVEVIAETPASVARARLHQELGCLSYYDFEDTTLALEHLERACDDDPRGVGLEAETLTALEGLYEDLDDQRGLLQVYASKVQLAEDGEMRSVYQLLMAQLHWEHFQEIDAARGLLEAIVERDPSNEPALRMLADLEAQAGHAQAAAQRYRRLLEVLPEDSFESHEALAQLGILYQSLLDEPEEAKRCLWRVVERSPSQHEVLGPLREACEATDDWTGALTVLTRQIELLLGVEFEATSDRTDALLALDEEGIPPHMELEVCRLMREAADILDVRLQQPERAWALYGKLLTLHPEDPSALEQRLRLDRSLGQWSALCHDLERWAAMLLNPAERFEAFAEAGRVALEHLKRPALGCQLLEQALELSEASSKSALSPTRREEVRALLEEASGGAAPSREGASLASPPGGVEETKQRLLELQELLRSERDREARGVLLLEKGSLLASQPGRQRDALISLRAALALDPDQTTARLALIDVLIATGEFEQAINQLLSLTQRQAPSTLPASMLREILTFAEILTSTGHPRVNRRADALLERLRETARSAGEGLEGA